MYLVASLDNPILISWLSLMNRCISHINKYHQFLLADRTNGRAYATVLRLSVVICDIMYCG